MQTTCHVGIRRIHVVISTEAHVSRDQTVTLGSMGCCFAVIPVEWLLRAQHTRRCADALSAVVHWARESRQ
jgi:hypothetical protein